MKEKEKRAVSFYGPTRKMCAEYQLEAPDYQLVSDRRGGRTAWSCFVTVCGRRSRSGHQLAEQSGLIIVAVWPMKKWKVHLRRSRKHQKKLGSLRLTSKPPSQTASSYRTFLGPV
ncbi:hypothetical protein F5Y17DRAFT_376952 [Xylariaceae sp. FL0594]|nr:hypothetical protein F5Y17DRAFT_376952 [Xylariaceae sp. FL0594]